jgi:cell division protein FtsQ
MTTLATSRPARTPVPVRPPHRRWPYLLALALVLTLMGGVGYVVYRTPVFGLQQVDVVAESGDLTQDVAQAVKSAVDAPQGTPLISLDLDAIRNDVLSVPQVATASVLRRWPNDLQIRVTQRVPAAVTSANGALWLLDATGTPYMKAPAGVVPAGLLTVELATPGPKDPATLAALSVIAGMNHATRSIVASVSARSAYTITLKLLDGRTVIWGSPDDSPKKLQILPAVLAQPGHVYDVSDPEYVTVSP